MTKSGTPKPADPAELLAAATGPDSAPRGSKRRPSPAWLVIAVPGLAELVIGGYQLGQPSLWRDEGYTVEVSARPVGAIFAMLRRQDAVHGFYYLIMHVVVSVAGTSAVALRVPSLLAMAAAAGLTAELGRRLALETRSPAPAVTGLLAGLLFTLLPLTTWYAEDARPYALTTLSAVGASWLLIRAVQDRRWRWYAFYAAAIVLLGLFNLLAVLLVPAHGVSLLIVRRRSVRVAEDDGGRYVSWTAELRWLAAIGLAGVALSPLLLAAVRQQAQQAWVPSPPASDVGILLGNFAGTAVLIPVVATAAILCVAAELGRGGSRGWSTPALALPWLALPPAVLLGASVLLHPVYDKRYVLYCMPAMALLTAAGLVRLGYLLVPTGPGHGRRLVCAALPWVVVAGMAAILAGPQSAVRKPSARPDNLGGVAAVVAAHALPGDAVIYIPWSANVAGLAYPGVFGKLRDIGQAQSPVSSDTLHGVAVPGPTLLGRIGTVRRVWVVRWAHQSDWRRVRRQLVLLLSTMKLARSWRVRSLIVSLYQARGT